MSIHIMDHVWNSSRHKGSALLLLLAVADHANDLGIAWPGLVSLAKKTRLTKRNVQRLIVRLEDEAEKPSELRLRKGEGPRGCHLYQVWLPVMDDCSVCLEAQSHAPSRFQGGGDNLSPAHLCPDDKLSGGVTLVTPESSLEPPLRSCEKVDPEEATRQMARGRRFLTPGGEAWEATQ